MIVLTQTHSAAVLTFRREYDRFWILVAHPEQNLFAAGHDAGMMVFKLERERPPYISQTNEALFYLKDRTLRLWEYSSGRDIALMAIRKTGPTSKIRTVSYSPEDKTILFSYVSCFERFVFFFFFKLF